MRALGRFLVRVSAFVGKEMLEILRQPRLVLLLVFGPFLVLALFGVGYVGLPPSFRTVFVAQPESTLARQIPDYAGAVSPQLVYYGLTGDQQQALDALARGEIDLVIVAPADAEQRLRSNEQATFMVYHNQLDPLQADYVRYFANTIVEGVNRRVLTTAAAEGQQETRDVHDDVRAARENAAATRMALQAGNAAEARQSQGKLADNLDAISVALAAGTMASNASGDQAALDEAKTAINTLRADNTALGQAQAANESNDAQIARVTKMEQDLARLDEQLATFQSVSPNILVSPFAADTRSISSVQPTMIGYFIPAVLALLLQHLAVTLAALSIVREQQLGAMELFRVSPVSAGETLAGKYISYMIFQGILMAVLTGLVIWGLGMYMLGNWWQYVGVVAAVAFASLGYGFVISLLSQSDTQAVQLTMLVLLLSVFFSGFFMALDQLVSWLHVLSWALPVTYGISLLRNIMLRGPIGLWYEIAALVGIGVALAIIAWLLLRRRMRRA